MYWKKISLAFLLILFAGVSLYAIRATRCLRWEKFNSTQLVDQLKTERKAMISRDVGLSFTHENNLYQIVREVRDKLYENNWSVKNPEPFKGEYGDIYLKYNLIFGNRYAFSCGDASQVYAWALSSLDIPHRVVQLAAKSFIDGKKQADTHVVTEVFDGKKWFISDPTFNAEYYCSDGDSPLSTKELKECVDKGQEIVPKYGKTIIPDRIVETYYIPLKDLLYAYTLYQTSIGNKIIPIEEHPFPDWINISLSNYNNH